MYNESTTIVDVVATTDGYALSIKAGDLYIAYDVVRRHVDDDGARHFAQMTKSEITEDGYAFTFDTGDVFTCAAADEYPASETLSDDSSGGGSGGGVLVVHDANGTLDKTWAEIDAADVAAIVYSRSADGVTVRMRDFVMGTVCADGVYSVDATGVGRTTYETDSADGYPVKKSS